MRAIDLNADTGEADTAEWQAVEAAIMGYITSANIACGGHAGDDESMRRTVSLALENNVNIGAHPAYPDRENFGRKPLILGTDISSLELANSITAQISRLAEIASEQGGAITYVKAHGALYNDAVFDIKLADLIAETVAHIDCGLWLMGAPNSCLTQAAHDHGLKFIAEGFIDRRYTDDGHLLSRKEDSAVLKSQTERENQAISLLTQGQVFTNTGQPLSLDVDTFCIHSDSPGADKTAKTICDALISRGADIKAFTNAG
ncbi:MAG: LamB/YcsF family protein [Hellea sp.]|nr:LamB/YcsF family protein [Hellea sp.]